MYLHITDRMKDAVPHMAQITDELAKSFGGYVKSRSGTFKDPDCVVDTYLRDKKKKDNGLA